MKKAQQKDREIELRDLVVARKFAARPGPDVRRKILRRLAARIDEEGLGPRVPNSEAPVPEDPQG